MTAVQFRHAIPDDAARLSEIAFAAKRHWGYPPEWLELWRPDLTISSRYLETEKIGVAESKGEAVGFAGLSTSGLGRQIEHLWVLPSYMGGGVGRRLFAEMVLLARDEGVSELLINSDPNAEVFYLKMGAVRVGEEIYFLPGGIRRVIPRLVYRLD